MPMRPTYLVLLLVPAVATAQASRPQRKPDAAPVIAVEPADTIAAPTKPVSLNAYAPTGGDVAGRHFRAYSAGPHPKVARYGAFSEMVTEGSGRASGPESADYGLGIAVSKKDWFKSDSPGEMDGLTVFCRNGVGDCAGILSNVAARSGFAATLESYTGDLAPGTGIATKAVGLQMGVINSRDGGETGSLGYVAIAKTGDLSTAFRVQNDPGARWAKAYMSARDGLENFYVDGARGTIVTADAVRTGWHATGPAAVQIGYARAGPGPSCLVLSVGADNLTDASLCRTQTRGGTLDLLNAGSGQSRILAGDRVRFAADDKGVGFNGAGPVGKQVLAPAFADPARATNAELATAYNSLRAALVNLGLAQ